MSTSTQYNPIPELNTRLIEAGASKTVYALVTPEIETVKRSVLNNDEHLCQFRDAWTAKQDAYHEEFFDKWVKWSSRVIDFDRSEFQSYYPTAGASEALRHIIYHFAVKKRSLFETMCHAIHSLMDSGRLFATKEIHIFEGEYEGYRAYGEACGLRIVEHARDDYLSVAECPGIKHGYGLFFISQPSAIDGNVWGDFNDFLSRMPESSVVADLTYVGAVPQRSFTAKFDVGQPCVRNIVFSLSKPFGAYYDRIGGVFCRQEDPGLFGNKWFKNLTSLRIGTELMTRFGVFYMPNRYWLAQKAAAAEVGERLGIDLRPSDVFVLAGADEADDPKMAAYLARPAQGRLRVCLTPEMAKAIGTTGAVL